MEYTVEKHRPYRSFGPPQDTWPLKAPHEYYKTPFMCLQVWVQQGTLFHQVPVHHTT